jgi:hypothetical protein
MLSSLGHPGDLPTKHVPVQVEDGLAAARADVDDDTVVGEAGTAGDLGHELEHPLRLVRRELADVAEGVDVPLGQDEQVRLRLRVDVPDRDEAVAGGDVLAVPDEPAEEAVRQRGSPPR